MQISIAERLKPFSHLPGTSTILPGAGYQVQIFPCLIKIFELDQSQPKLVSELNLELSGPLEQFTICNDLEKGRISVWGMSPMGWLKYHLISSKHVGLRLYFEKVPNGKILIVDNQLKHQLQEKNGYDILLNGMVFEPYQPPFIDRLFLGNHKAQDWELIKRRLDLTEIFPLWHRLGQMVPQLDPVLLEGTLTLLDKCERSLNDRDVTYKEKAWLNLFLAGFQSMLAPRLFDTDFQGLVPDNAHVSSNLSPLLLLTEGSKLIRQLFFQQENQKIEILPHLFPTLHCGRLIDVPLQKGGRLSLEWSKKSIRRLVLFVEHDQELTIHFRSHVKSFRLRHTGNLKGERHKSNSPIFFEKQNLYYFDNFKQ